MSSETAIGPDDTTPQKGDATDRAIIEGVDAQAANDADMRLVNEDAEAKPARKEKQGKVSSGKSLDESKDGLARHADGPPPQSGQQGASANVGRKHEVDSA